MIQIISQEQDFFGLRDEWRRLFKEYDRVSYYETFDGVLAAWNIMEKPYGSVLYVLVEKMDGRITCIVPLVTRQRGFWKLVKPIGSDVAFSCDILGAPFDPAIWNAIRRAGNVLQFESLRQDSMWWKLMNENGIGSRSTDSAPYLDLQRWPNFAEYVRTRPKAPARSHTKWNSLQVARRRLAGSGEVRFNVYSDDGKIEEIVEWMTTIKKIWLRGHRLPHSRNWRNITLAKAHDAAKTGNLMLCELMSGQTRAAASLNYVTDKCFEGYMVAVDDFWRACSPGKLILYETIQWAFANGLHRVDLGTGSQPYKFLFTDTDVLLTRGLAVPLDFVGTTYEIVRQWRREIRHYFQLSDYLSKLWWLNLWWLNQVAQ